MAGAMRRMGIYLGLVEDDDTRGYGRYDSRPSDELEHDRRYGGYAEDRYEDDYADRSYDDDFAGGYADAEPVAAELSTARDPEPLSVRRVQARPLGLAPTGAGSSSIAARLGGMNSGPVGAAGLAVREPVVAPEPEPEPVSAPVAKTYRITTLHPRTYNEARTIGERFRDGMPVIMNLTEMDDADAKRLVDFAAGLSFGLRGSIERVTAKVFLLSPQDVAVTPEDKAKIREGGFSEKS
ncbi:cell division protein SepF [Blastococcus xanthinilyticus]|uniref:Cell division protein SepF n=1 Tax=Blastococcus xanthinilyticus TaxID=1564164 RepID=A0A5S5CYY3_9ACTN|nr:cell division protein SepF [Blastococcus xanthinilyticus]TYP88304.1 cell division inhibitor SepF [Blastococcus xanthinilyticus]